MSPRNGHIRFGRFVLDKARLSLTEKGKPVPLTPKAFDLLRVLVENPGRLLTKDELMQLVWVDSFVEEGNLAYTVRLLRKALGDDASSPIYIESVPRRGYRFIAKCYEDGRDGVNDPAVFHDRQSQNDDDSSLIGRSSSVVEIVDLLGDDRVRLLTLTGTGGTGKTRLAKEVADRAGELFRYGVRFIELANLSDPQLVPLTIAQELNLRDSGMRPPIEVLTEHFREKPALLVLDNFEQVISAGVQLATLLRGAPDLKLLVTSREPLKLSLEREYRVPPLELPELRTSETLSQVLRYGSVQLFVRRAKEARPDIEFSNDQASLLASICRKLDGLPLALELAASRVKVLSLAELLAKLENRLAVLTGGPNDLHTRQQTMRGTIDWSYAMLSDRDKRLFETLSVFEGSFTLASAESVEKSLLDGAGTNVVDAIESLTEKGLLVSEKSFNDELRFRMLIVVRDYASEMLSTRSDRDEVRVAHTEFVLNLVEAGCPHLFSTNCGEWLDRFEAELDNIRVALRWSLEHNPEFAARILAVVRHLAALRMHISEVRSWLEEGLQRSEEISPRLVGELLTGLGIVCQYQRDLENARSAHERSLAISRDLASDHMIARALRGLAAIDYMELKLESARESATEALKISKSIGDQFGEAATLARLADISTSAGDYLVASEFGTKALATFRAIDYKPGIISKLVNVAINEFLLENYALSHQYLIESVNLAIDISDYIDFRIHLEIAAALSVRDRNYRRAALFSGAAAASCEDMNYFHEPMEQSFRDKYLKKLRAAIPDVEFDAAYNEGTRLSVAESITLILNTFDSPRESVHRLHLVGKNLKT